MSPQEYTLRRQKGIPGSMPFNLPPINIHSPPRVPYSSQHYQNALLESSSSPLSGSRSSSFSNTSWTSAQESFSSKYSSNASPYFSSASTNGSPCSESYNPHRSALNSLQAAEFKPPTMSLDQLLDRLSCHDVPKSDLALIREHWYPMQNRVCQDIPPIASGPLVVDSCSNGTSKAPIKKDKYKTELCRSWEEQGVCRYGLKCLYAHGPQELKEVHRHPKYKTELCHSFYNTGSCPYAKRCVFVHSTASLKSDSCEEKENNNERKTPLLSRVGVRDGPTPTEQATSVDVQGRQDQMNQSNYDFNIQVPIMEKWGREMSSFPLHWLNNSMVDYATKIYQTTGSNTDLLRAGMRPLSL